MSTPVALARLSRSILIGSSAILVAGSGVIHLHLWEIGYRSIPRIGPLFLAQGVVAALLGLDLALDRHAIPIVLALVLMLGTIAAFLVAVNIGLLGFRDNFAAPFATVAFVEELAAVVVLSARALLLRARTHR